GSVFFLAGIVSGAAGLTRTSHLAVTLFLLGLLVWVFRRQPAAACQFALAFVLGAAVLLSPWLIRNQLTAGRFAMTSEAGSLLAAAHNAYTFQYYPYRSIDDSWRAFHVNMPEGKRQELDDVAADEFAVERWYCRQALEYIRAHPAETIVHGFH